MYETAIILAFMFGYALGIGMNIDEYQGPTQSIEGYVYCGTNGICDAGLTD